MIECAAGFIKDFCLIQSLRTFYHLFTYSLAILTCNKWSDLVPTQEVTCPQSYPFIFELKAMYFIRIQKNIHFL